MELDPRPWGIQSMLSTVRHKILVLSGKGGVGKTLATALLGLAAARKGLPVGALDLDVTDPNLHVVLGVDPEREWPGEKKGILPVHVAGLKFMSVAFFTRGRAAPLRGREASEAIREILSATNWGQLELLLVDMPPGLGEEMLETLKLIPEPIALAIGTPSRLSRDSLARLLSLLVESMPARRILLLENMTRGEAVLASLAREYGARYVGSIPYDPRVEEALGDPSRLLDTGPGRASEGIIEAILDYLGS